VSGDCRIKKSTSSSTDGQAFVNKFKLMLSVYIFMIYFLLLLVQFVAADVMEITLVASLPLTEFVIR